MLAKGDSPQKRCLLITYICIQRRFVANYKLDSCASKTLYMYSSYYLKLGNKFQCYFLLFFTFDIITSLFVFLLLSILLFQVAVSQRCLPLKCVICRTRILKLRQSDTVKVVSSRPKSRASSAYAKFINSTKVHAK